MTTAFSVYGSKSRLVHHYPKPRHKLIIEPFAGGANYSLAYYNHDVLLHDLNEVVLDSWKFLQHPDALEWIRQLPYKPACKTPIEELLPKGSPPEMRHWVMAVMARGTAGSIYANRNMVTTFGHDAWTFQIRASQLVVKQIKHWKIRRGDYREIDNQEATWFIDPPYSGRAGKHYVHASHHLDYEELADWCKSRKGQVIVCEMGNADWLPFETLVMAERLGHRKSFRYKEVMWYREK